MSSRERCWGVHHLGWLTRAIAASQEGLKKTGPRERTGFERVGYRFIR